MLRRHCLPGAGGRPRVTGPTIDCEEAVASGSYEEVASDEWRSKMTPRAGLKTGHYKTFEEGYRFAPKASRRPSQSFTTNSRQCHGMLPSRRVNSAPWAAYSA
jgi:hypothetical protein